MHIFGWPGPPGFECREPARTGVPSRTTMSYLVIRASDPFTHASPEDGREKIKNPFSSKMPRFNMSDQDVPSKYSA